MRFSQEEQPFEKIERLPDGRNGEIWYPNGWADGTNTSWPVIIADGPNIESTAGSIEQAETALASLHAVLLGGVPEDYMHPDGRSRIPEQKPQEIRIESTPPEQQQGEQ